MITESVVVDVSQDWAVACGLQERFCSDQRQPHRVQQSSQPRHYGNIGKGRKGAGWFSFDHKGVHFHWSRQRWWI